MDFISSRARSDYNQARFKARLNRIWDVVSGQPNKLLSFEKVKKTLDIGTPIYRGIQTVRLEQIIGSLNRHQEFDRRFLPAQNNTSERWLRVNRAFYQSINLPLVILYKAGEIYFVVDGHHRISVARKQGQVFIDAEVHEFSAKMKFSPDLKTKDFEMLSVVK